MKKALSIILGVILAVIPCAVAFAAFDAPKLNRKEWDDLYTKNLDNNTIPMLCVGEDETQVSLCWHAGKSEANATVRLSEKEDMSEAKTFTGKTTDAENAQQLVCRVTISGLKENTT